MNYPDNNTEQQLREHITRLCANESFRHHQWFAQWHLALVERISLECAEKFYPEADKTIMSLMAWLHDYGKIVDQANEFDHKYINEIVDIVKQHGYDASVVKTVSENVLTLDEKVDLPNAPIEVQIVSSADAASHFTGPFQAAYWYENPHKPLRNIMTGELEKWQHDWDIKMVIPEMKEAFAWRYQAAREHDGDMPERFFS